MYLYYSRKENIGVLISLFIFNKTAAVFFAAAVFSYSECDKRNVST